MQKRRGEQLIVGRIVGLLGVKGWVKIESYTDPRENIQDYSPWQLRLGGEIRQFNVEAVQRQGKGMAAKLESINDRDQAAELLRSEILIDSDQLQALESDQFYWQELIGLSVVNRQDELLGQVTSLFETGANDVLVVRNEQGQEVLIPFVLQQVVLAVDKELGQIQVDWEADWL